MGNYISHSYLGEPPKEIPNFNEKPTFDPEYGFKNPRKPRESKLSIQEMKALQIPKKNRDYCAHFYRDFLVCVRYYTPFNYACEPEKHAYEHCQVEDSTLRIKEYEREKRLRMRKLRKEGVVN